MKSSLSVSKSDLCPVCIAPTKLELTKPLRSDKDIVSCLEHFRDKKQEYLICLSLDGGHRLIARRVITIGLVDASLVHPREVFAGALADRAVSVIIAHNHPSGIARPSSKDIATTQQLIAAGILLGISLRDHFIITKSSHFSFREHGLLSRYG